MTGCYCHCRRSAKSPLLRRGYRSLPRPTHPRFHLPAEEAAKMMRVSLTVLKRVARKQGINRCARAGASPPGGHVAVARAPVPAALIGFVGSRAPN